MERYIYYSGQRNWTMDDYDYLNSFLTKIFQYRNKEINIYKIKHMNLYAMKHTTKALIKAILLENGFMDEIISDYENLRSIVDVKPLDEPLYLTPEPCNLFKHYKEMNIIV